MEVRRFEQLQPGEEVVAEIELDVARRPDHDAALKKPEDAAKIFETLDMPILLNVIQRMKPKNTAPILAKMPPEKAKEVTVALTKIDQLPQVK